MKTKKLYITPKLEVINIDTMPILAASGGSSVPGGTTGASSPWGTPTQQSTLGTSEYFNSWDDTENDVAEM